MGIFTIVLFEPNVQLFAPNELYPTPLPNKTAPSNATIIYPWQCLGYPRASHVHA